MTKSGKTKTKSILVPLIPVVEQPDSIYGGQGIQSDQVDCEGSYDNPYVKHEFPQCKSKVEHITSLLIYFLNKLYIRHSMIMFSNLSHGQWTYYKQPFPERPGETTNGDAQNASVVTGQSGDALIACCLMP